MLTQLLKALIQVFILLPKFFLFLILKILTYSLTGIGIPGLFGARFGASNAAATANSAGFGGAYNF